MWRQKKKKKKQVAKTHWSKLFSSHLIGLSVHETDYFKKEMRAAEATLFNWEVH